MSGKDLKDPGWSRAGEMDPIDARELKDKLDREDDFKLVMALGEWEYNASHIPGSLRVSTAEEALKTLDPRDEIVVYDSGPGCPASRMASRALKHHGYQNVRRYPGGLQEWSEAGYPLEGRDLSAGG